MKDLGLGPGGGDNIATPSHPSATHEHMHTTPEGPTITSTPQPIQNMDPYEAHQVDLRYLEGPRKHPKMVVKPETYEGKGDWAEYIPHFEDCAELGGGTISLSALSWQLTSVEQRENTTLAWGMMRRRTTSS